MIGLLDTTNKKVRLLAWDMVAGEESQPVVVRVVAGDFTLKSGESADVKVKAREHGTADPYLDLAAGIDLSVYTPGGSVDFDLIVEADPDLTGLRRIALFVGVTRSSGAGWTD